MNRVPIAKFLSREKGKAFTILLSPYRTSARRWRDLKKKGLNS